MGDLSKINLEKFNATVKIYVDYKPRLNNSKPISMGECQSQDTNGYPGVSGGAVIAEWKKKNNFCSSQWIYSESVIGTRPH